MGTAIQGSPVANAIYGCGDVPPSAWIPYAYALLAIAGADHEVSEEEYGWLYSDFVEIIGGDGNVKEAIARFDFKNADLAALLGDVSLELPINYRRALIYDAVRMSQADNHYSEHERQAVATASELLGIPHYLAKTIEGLVHTERSLEMTRKSIFEVGDQPIVDYFNQKMKNTSVMVRNIFGIGATTDDTQLNYGCALMIIAGADGEVSHEELDWYLNVYVKMEDTPEHIVEQVLAFDYHQANLAAVLAKLTADVPINFPRTLLYNSIKMAKADKHYAEAEKTEALRAAALLGIDQTIAMTIEYMVETEEKIAKMRRTLFDL